MRGSHWLILLTICALSVLSAPIVRQLAANHHEIQMSCSEIGEWEELLTVGERHLMLRTLLTNMAETVPKEERLVQQDLEIEVAALAEKLETLRRKCPQEVASTQ